jgi:hypothetical protein
MLHHFPELITAIALAPEFLRTPVCCHGNRHPQALCAPRTRRSWSCRSGDPQRPSAGVPANGIVPISPIQLAAARLHGPAVFQLQFTVYHAAQMQVRLAASPHLGSAADVTLAREAVRWCRKV